MRALASRAQPGDKTSVSLKGKKFWASRLSGCLSNFVAQILAGKQAMPRLFCIPLLVKDNYDTVGMSASNGAYGLLDNFPAQDAYQVSVYRLPKPCTAATGPWQCASYL